MISFVKYNFKYLYLDKIQITIKILKNMINTKIGKHYDKLKYLFINKYKLLTYRLSMFENNPRSFIYLMAIRIWKKSAVINQGIGKWKKHYWNFLHDLSRTMHVEDVTIKKSKEKINREMLFSVQPPSPSAFNLKF